MLNSSTGEKRRLLELILQKEDRDRNLAFDPFKIKSRPTDQQTQVMKDIFDYRHRYVLGGNQSGKTQLGAREGTWFFKESHPFWSRPSFDACPRCKSEDVFPVLDENGDHDSDAYGCKACDYEWRDWGDEPLTLLVLARSTDQYREIWEKKLRPFLTKDEYKVEKQGNIIKLVRNLKNGNKFIFVSHNNPDEARELAQMYSAHWVWLDEMPKSFALLEELHKRVQANRGYFLATFTPKIVVREIRSLVDRKSSIHKKYKLHTLNNPIYGTKKRREELLEEHAGYSEELRKTVLEGDWFGGERAVYDFNPETDILRLPSYYSNLWRHLVAVDPAASGKCGLIVLAEDPEDGRWYTVIAEYLKGAAGTDLIESIEKKVKSMHVVKRVCDPHEVWFIKEAAKQKIFYVGVENKKERKDELVKNLGEAVKAKGLIVTTLSNDLQDEFITCQWNEAGTKIVGASRFHLLDALQYGLDNLPKHVREMKPMTWAQNLRLQSKKYEEKKAKAQKSRTVKRRRTLRSRRRGSRLWS